MEELRENAAMRAPLTLLAYASDMKFFREWCSLQGCCALPATTEDVCRYILHQLNTGRRVTTVARYATAITAAHRDVGLEPPCPAALNRLIRAAKRIRKEQPVQKEPVSLDRLRDISAGTGSGIVHTRNKALTLFGFASALRRSNIAALDLADLRFTPRGLLVSVRQEKQDQFGVGRTLGILTGHHPETCPLLALAEWLALRGALAGPLFQRVNNGVPRGRLHPNRISLILKAQVAALGLDPAAYGAHSLRSGFVSAAVEANVNWLTIMETTGHRSVESLRRYYRSRDPLRAVAAAHIDM
jgi:integrase